MRNFMNLVENHVIETKIIDDFGDDAYQMSRVMERWTKEGETGNPVHEIGNYIIREKSIGGQVMYYFFLDDQCVGKSTFGLNNGTGAFDDTDMNALQEIHIVIHPDHRRKGLAMGLYNYLLKDKNIISDYDHTRFSKGLWQQLANKYVVRPYVNGKIGEPTNNIDQFYNEDRLRLVASLR